MKVIYLQVDGTGKPVSSASASDSLAGKFATGLTATAHAQTKAYSKEVLIVWPASIASESPCMTVSQFFDSAAL